MTNRELLQAAKETLNAVDRQRQYVLQIELTPVPCPACKKPVDAITASGMDVDQYDFKVTRREFQCPNCQAELEQVVPFFFAAAPGWFWQLKDSWLQKKLQQANAWEELVRK